MSSHRAFYQWVVSTPSLIKNDHRFSHLSFLHEQESQKLANYQGNQRLGFVYQHLCREAFIHSNRYQIALEEIQINDNGKTAGAIDFVLHDSQTEQYEHWEVAIKFYLLLDDFWYGPNAKDRLDIKSNHMLEHQLNMTNHPVFLRDYAQYPVRQHKALLQGRLYSNPFLNQPIPTHCGQLQINESQINGFWCYHSQWLENPFSIAILHKHQWAIGSDQLTLTTDIAKDKFVHGLDENGQFWFVMPDSWPGDHKVAKA